MDKDYLIEKWLNNDLNESDKEAFSKLDDSQFNQDIIEEVLITSQYGRDFASKPGDFSGRKSWFRIEPQVFNGGGLLHTGAIVPRWPGQLDIWS